MKKFRKLIPALCMLLISAMLMGTSTYAWFSMNTTVTATGMQVTATSASSLVITNNAANINTTATNKIGMAADPSPLIPATHMTASTYNDGLGGTLSYSKEDNDSYLCHVKNTEDVDAITGNVQDGKILVFEKSVNGTKKYYTDYTVYVAVKGDALDNQVLTAKIKPDVSKTIYNAISIDYWVNGTYKATKAFKNAATEDKLIDGGTIPSAGAASDNYITILMRVYFDGALQNSGSAYVNNGTIDTNAVTFEVAFEIAPKAAA